MYNPTVLDLFLERVVSVPESMALVAPGKALTYAELNRQSDRIAAHLRSRNIGKGDMVPILAERSIHLIVALLGVMKTGAAYVPIDNRYPDRRKASIAEQCSASVILSTSLDAANIAGRPVFSIDTLLEQAPATEAQKPAVPAGKDAVYVIFTSGTSGLPKGVIIEHHPLVSLVRWHNERFGMHRSSRTTLMAGVGFDVSQWEIWSALCAGATIHLMDDDTRLSPDALLGFYARHKITHAFVPTVLVPDVVSAHQPNDLALQCLFTAGEKLHPVETDHLSYALVDYYGPTEATIFATCHIVPSKRLNRPPSIGFPVAGCEALILDGHLQDSPRGEPGELFLAGDCLARGYLGNPGLTAERFIEPAAFGRRLYRTGDLARWLPDGSIQFLGRSDGQVKIRGNRVELGEVEAALLRCPGVKAAVTLVDERQGTADKRLVAFVAPSESHATHAALISRLRFALKSELPDYMLPSRYLCLDRFPCNLNGKVDKDALRAFVNASCDAAAEQDNFASDAERRVATVFRDMLGHSDFNADSNFFDIGGHSLLASAVMRELASRFDVKTYIRDIYENRSVRSLAAELHQRGSRQAPELDSEPIRALEDDVRLPVDVGFSSGFDRRQLTAPKRILLTGATGFVGVHLLAELLAKTEADIVCPVRGHDSSAALTRLCRVAARYKVLIDEPAWQRVHVYAGDLSEPRLGLQREIHHHLAETTDVVYHSASSVNFIQPYSFMRKDNVEGLRNLIHFAAHRRVKPLVLLSTISVYSWGHLHTGKTLMYESDDIDQNLPAVITDLGYVRSKWVMEKIADLAASRGLPLMTFRLGYAMCHSRTGAFADYQWWSRLIRTCLMHGAVPDLRDLREGLTTVDYLVEAIATISRNADALGKKLNLIPSPDENLTLRAFFDLLERSCGLKFRVLPFSDWVALWESDRQAPLYPLLSMFKDNMYGGKSTVELYQDTYLWDCRNVKHFLANSGVREPVFDAELLNRYLARLRESAPPA